MLLSSFSEIFILVIVFFNSRISIWSYKNNFYPLLIFLIWWDTVLILSFSSLGMVSETVIGGRFPYIPRQYMFHFCTLGYTVNTQPGSLKLSFSCLCRVSRLARIVTLWPSYIIPEHVTQPWTYVWPFQHQGSFQIFSKPLWTSHVPSHSFKIFWLISCLPCYLLLQAASFLNSCLRLVFLQTSLGGKGGFHW